MGESLYAVFNQDQHDTLPPFLQLLFLGLLLFGFWQSEPTSRIPIDKVALQLAFSRGKLTKQQALLAQAKNLEEFASVMKQIAPSVVSLLQPSQNIPPTQPERRPIVQP